MTARPAHTPRFVGVGATLRPRAADLAATLVMAVVFGLALWAACGMSLDAGLMPRFVAILGLVATTCHLLTLLFARTRPAAAPDSEVQVGEVGDDHHVFATADRRRWVSTLISVAAFFGLLWVVGVYVTAVVFSLGYLRLQARTSWLLAIGYACAVGGTLYLVFEIGLSVEAPTGLLDVR